MSHSISTLLTRNLHEVFGEGDPARRRATIDELLVVRAKSEQILGRRVSNQYEV